MWRTSLVGGLLRRLAGLLDSEEREAVLGDLAEEGVSPISAVLSVGGLALRRVVLRAGKGGQLLPSALAADIAFAEADVPQPWPVWAIPLAFGLVAACCVVALIVPSPSHPLTWPGLVSRSVWLLAGAALAALTTVALVHRGFRDYLGRPGATLLACAWSTAIWIPLLLLVWTEHAIWVVLAPVPIAAMLASFAKRRSKAHCGSVAEQDEVAVTSRPLDFQPALQPVYRVATSAALCAVVLEAAAATAAAGQIACTCSLLIAATACLAWNLTPDATPSASRARVRSRVAVLPCFLLTCLALTPFLRAGLGAGHLGGIVLANPMAGAPRLVDVPGHVYPGVVLLAPPLPKRKLITAPPKALLGGVIHPTRPLIIPFDGAYWYYQEPEKRPRPDAKVMRGDPLKNHVHSSADYTPIQMEAHQRLGTRLEASCCRSLAVAFANGDTRRGLIEVEAELRNSSRSGTQSVSLGTVPLRSSMGTRISLNRARVNETLQFPLQGKASTFQFNEIALIFKLARERNLAGARVQVVNFTLQP